ncbi:TetR/AcrR family transcriptional regulator [Paenibacillus sp. OK076]|uniref:TetR/AcrR family transcriptional regulator n=1 Tax=Paenibacillus sp. OK076 TaxID=1884379 RepID=UPI0008AD0898|nr:TetR/AcrR family transcriptional regulator [Paenibacillus sp. OK076]SEN80316.1 transcriptional regulator, TetR family [Paenibacillus sp. OK076]
MTPRTKEQNEEIRLRRLAQIRKAAADVFLNKGPLLEIRDVAAQAGLGYGTVYHYYSNKGDLLNDLLWDALERAEGWPDAPRDSALGEEPASGPFVLGAAVHTGNAVATNSSRESHETTASAELGPVAAASVQLLQLWAEDHALYLLHKLAVEGFASLPEARSATLLAAFQHEVVAPFAALVDTGHASDGDAASGGKAAEQPYGLQRAEMLLAALVGCASLSMRRDKLHGEAMDIVRILKL